jgi:hypothetical protein
LVSVIKEEMVIAIVQAVDGDHKRAIANLRAEISDLRSAVVKLAEPDGNKATDVPVVPLRPREARKRRSASASASEGPTGSYLLTPLRATKFPPTPSK